MPGPGAEVGWQGRTASPEATSSAAVALSRTCTTRGLSPASLKTRRIAAYSWSAVGSTIQVSSARSARWTTGRAAAGWPAASATNCGSRAIRTRCSVSAGTFSGKPSLSCTKATSNWSAETIRSRALAEMSMWMVVSVSGSRSCTRRSQAATALLPTLPIRSRRARSPLAVSRASWRAAATSAAISAITGRARDSTEWPSAVGRLPVCSRVNSVPPTARSMRCSCVVREGWVMPSWSAALRRLPLSAIAHSTRRCLTSSSTSGA